MGLVTDRIRDRQRQDESGGPRFTIDEAERLIDDAHDDLHAVLCDYAEGSRSWVAVLDALRRALEAKHG